MSTTIVEATGPHNVSDWHGALSTSAQQCSQLREIAHEACCESWWHKFKTDLNSFGFAISSGTEVYGPTKQGGSPASEVKMLVRKVRLEQHAHTLKHPFTVCETGFNWGSSAFAHLCASSTTVVHSFDLPKGYRGKGSDVLAFATRWLDTQFPGNRLKLHLGDSTELVPKSKLTCDFVFVDGGHSYQVASKDMRAFASLTPAGTLFINDDCFSNGDGGKPGVHKAYTELIRDGTFTHVEDITFASVTNRGVCVARRSNRGVN